MIFNSIYRKESTPPPANTWLLNENLRIYTDGPGSFSENKINFISNGEDFAGIYRTYSGFELYLTYTTATLNATNVFTKIYTSTDYDENTATYSWLNEKYRTVTFETEPNVSLLGWLNRNGTKLA